MECIMEIGDKIRYLRRKSNMNQTELAQKLGVVTSTVGFWETGRRQPDLDAIVKDACFIIENTVWAFYT